MRALRLTAEWPVGTVAAALVFPDGTVRTSGPVHHRFRLASIAKMLVGYTVLIGCEEGTISLDQPVGQDGCTVRHLLAHAGGYPFDGADPIARPGQRRVYSNTGIEMAAEALAHAADMPFHEYLNEAVLVPLGMRDTELRGSPAHGVHSTVADLISFIAELRTPRLLSTEGAAQFRTVQFPGLSGIIPGVGRFDECAWGLGCEVRADKHPHWTGTHNSPGTFGHFGGAGTLLWVDPGVHVACVALTDRPFDEWAHEALQLWPAFSDAVLAEAGV